MAIQPCCFGNIKVQYMGAFSDVDKREFATLLPLIILTLVMGIYPEIFLDPMHLSCSNLLAQLDVAIVMSKFINDKY